MHEERGEKGGRSSKHMDNRDWKDSRMGAAATSSGTFFLSVVAPGKTETELPVVSPAVWHRTGYRTDYDR